MKILNIAAFIFLVGLCAPVFSDTNTNNETKREAENLLEIANTKYMMEQAVEQMLKLQLQQNPGLTPYREIMLEFINKHMSYSSLKPELIDLYSESFTAQELRDLTAFYKTPTGQKAIKKMPELMSKGGQIGAMRIQSNIQELQQMIKQESERLQLLQTQ